jgi:hypothetical protein
MLTCRHPIPCTTCVVLVARCQLHRISPLEPWRVIQSRRWMATKEISLRKELMPGGIIPSAAGITIYRGTAYPDKFHGQAFVGEVANNVIHRPAVAADGVTFRFESADADSEFVASTDTWFRPVNFVNAPDGTLHIVDMYRETVEHPWAVPDDLHAELDLTSGRERGRIYRLAPPGFRAPAAPRLGSERAAEVALTILERDAGDRWVLAAALRATPDQTVRMAERILREPSRWSGTGGREVLRQLLSVARPQNRRENLERLFTAFTTAPDTVEFERLFWSGLGEGLRQAGKSLRDAFPLTGSRAGTRVAALMDRAKVTARAKQLPTAVSIGSRANRMVGCSTRSSCRRSCSTMVRAKPC